VPKIVPIKTAYKNRGFLFTLKKNCGIFKQQDSPTYLKEPGLENVLLRYSNKSNPQKEGII
jgi:hypothetical protein